MTRHQINDRWLGPWWLWVFAAMFIISAALMILSTTPIPDRCAFPCPTEVDSQ